jgi:phospholipase/carboxylesterase
MKPLHLHELPPASGGKPESLCVLLHGLGADGADLIGMVPAIASLLPQTHFVAPDAPFPCDMSPSGYQWFSLSDWSVMAMRQGATQASPVLNAFLDAQLARFSLKDDKLALVGFSQGTMMALHVALERPQPCAGVVGFSGALVSGVVKSRPPVCLIHGMQDMVVPFPAMSQAAAFLGLHQVPVETHIRPQLAHGIDGEGIAIAARFLKARFG